jgi:regulator of protease activity HflC (stomatin/prohibitin superfamily)
MNFANALQGFVLLIWIVFVGLVFLAVVRASRGQKVRAISTSIAVVGALGLVLTSVSAGLVFIEPEERGVVISAVTPTGYRPAPLEPGLRWVIPFLERVERYQISRQTYTMSIAPLEGQVQGDDSVTARTSDGQEVLLDASVIYAVDPTQIIRLHIDWQKRYTIELVRPLSRGIMRDVVAQYGVEQVYSSKRLELTNQIRTDLETRLKTNGILLIDFILRNITFSPEYAASVEQKQIAEQQAQQAKFVVEQRKQEAEQARQVAQGRADADVIEAQGRAQARVIEADAEAQALDKIAAALAEKPELLTYQYITKLSPGIQVMLVPNDTPYLLPLPEMGPPAQTTTLVTPVPTPLPTPEPTTTP